MEFNNVDIEGLLFGIFAAFGGCTVRYGELYKEGAVNFKFYVIDALTAIFIGAFMFAYLTEELHISTLHSCLFNIVVGNLGSKAISILTGIVKKQFPGSFDQRNN